MLIIKDLIIWGFSIYIFTGNSIIDLYNTIIVYDCIECSANIILDVINTGKINISKYTIFETIIDKYIFYSLIIITSWIIHNYFYINYNIYINSLLLLTCIEPVKLAIIKSEVFNKLYIQINKKIYEILNYIFYKILKYCILKFIINYLKIVIEIDINDLKKINMTEIINFIKTIVKYFLIKYMRKNNIIQYTFGLVYKYNNLDFATKKNYLIEQLRCKKYNELTSVYSLDIISDIIIYSRNDNNIFEKIKEKINFDMIRFFFLWTLSYKMFILPILANLFIDYLLFDNSKYILYNLLGLSLCYYDLVIIGNIICVFGDRIFFFISQIMNDIKIRRELINNYIKILFEYLCWIIIMKLFNIGFIIFWCLDNKNDILMIGIIAYTSNYNLLHLLSMSFINSLYKISIIWLDNTISDNEYIEIESSHKIKEMYINNIIDNGESIVKINGIIKITDNYLD